MLSVKANKKMIQQHLLLKTGKTVILKDLQNIADKNRGIRVVNTNALVEEMKKIDGKLHLLCKIDMHS